MLAGAPNFRSLAGIQTADGRVVREGRLFRSEVLSRLTQDDINRVCTLDIGLVCDLRNPGERERERNRWPEQQNVRTVVRKQDADVNDAVRTDWETRLLEEHFDQEQARQYMFEAYRSMPQELAGHIVALVEYCSRPDSSGVLIHCMAGKDRTGFVCAMILSALGVPITTILDDYLESEKRFVRSDRMQSSLQRTFGTEIPPRAQRAAAAIGTVKTEYLQAAFSEIDRSYGSIEIYLASVAGLNNERLEQLRQQLLMPMKDNADNESCSMR